MGTELASAYRKAREARLQLARRDINTFLEYVMRDEATGKEIRQAPIHVAWQVQAERYNRLLLWAHVESGKCFGRGTPVMLADGRVKSVEFVEAGDRLMGPDGSVRHVLSTTSGYGPLFEIRPVKGVPWVCNEGHILTLVHTVTGEVIDIGLDDYLSRSAWFQSNYKLFHVPVRAFEGEQHFPIDPYFFGLWLGDGEKTQRWGARWREMGVRVIAISKPDREVEECARATAAAWGLRCVVDRAPGKCPRYRIVSEAAGKPNALLDAMREVMGEEHYFPRRLLTAPWNERAAFLAGIIDSDGHQQGGCVEVVQKNSDWADGIAWVALSLGLMATVKNKKVGKGTYRRVRMSGDFSEIPIRIERKRPGPRVTKRNALRTGFSVKEIGKGEWFGFTLDGDGRLLLGDFTVVHNTQQMAIGRVLFALGRDPSTRVAIVGNTHTQAEKLVKTIAKYLEESEELREVFPKLRPGEPWTTTQLTVERSVYSKDPSVQAFGVHGNVTGARLDLLIMDDILDFENCRTPRMREDVWSWYNSTLPGRLTSRARVICIGNAWHPDDALHKLSALPGWKSLRYSVLDEKGQTRWPDRWPASRIEAKKAELGPLEFARQMLCVARSDAESRFKQEWIDVCLRRGEGRSLAYGLQVVPPGCRVYTGVDLAVQKHSAADFTVLFTILVHPDGSREVIACERGKFTGPEIVEKIVDAHRRYQSVVIVENNAAQDFILQFARGSSAVPIRPFTTGRNKLHPEFGVESLAAEMANGKWIIPSSNGRPDAVLNPWITEMLYYDPAGHTGDCLMASWLAREGVRMGSMRVETGRLDLMSR